MRICVIIARFSISGVPLAQARLAQALADRGHDVDLVIGYVKPGISLPKLSNVKVIHFDRANIRWIFLPILHYLHERQPDIIFSAEDHLNIAVLTCLIVSFSKAKFSGSSRVTPYDTYSNKLLSKRWFLKILARLTMWRADVLTCVSIDMVRQYRNVFGNSKHVCVYNIVDNQENRRRMNESIDINDVVTGAGPFVVAAGQLERWKGFKDLIDAMAIVAERKDSKLIIFGEGSQREELQELIVKHGLRDRVVLPGNVANTLKYFAKANVFVLSSYVEGMPNVLVEAMMCGCTPVATDCPTGPRELLADGKFGYLAAVGNPRSIADAIEAGLDSPIAPNLLAEAVLPFREGVVVARHFQLLGIDAECPRV